MIDSKTLAAAALTGLLSAAYVAPATAADAAGGAMMQAEKTTEQAKEVHACKGHNSCKGQGGDGKNSCKGKGSCATNGKK